MVTAAQRKALVQIAKLSASTALQIATPGALAKAYVDHDACDGLIRGSLIYIGRSRLNLHQSGFKLTAVGWTFIEQELLKGV